MGTHGEFDFEKTRAVLADLATACRKRGIHRALLDVRDSHSNLTPDDLAALVNIFSENALSKYLRLGIVHTGNQEYRTKLFVFFSSMRGRKVRAFGDFEAAMLWLSKSEKEPEVEQESEFEVKPIIKASDRSRPKHGPSNN